MATVWRARDTRLGVERAVKILRSHLSEGKARTRMEREARVMAGLEHPHVTPIHDVGVDEHGIWIVMTLLSGGSVAERLGSGGPMRPREACRVALGVLSALEAAHAKGIVHRDIKPHNVLFDRDGGARLTDFGIARVASERGFTQTGAIMGTWAYMAPAQRVSARSADPRSDIYGVGALLAAMLTSHEPVDLHDPRGHAEQLAGIDPGVADVIKACTAFGISDRPNSAKAVQTMLRAAMARLPEDPARIAGLDTPDSEAGAGAMLAVIAGIGGIGMLAWYLLG